MSRLGEKELITIFLEELPHSRFLKNRFFESDAEVLTFNNDQLLFTTDEFSDEDLFRIDNPYRLGFNLAAATISDIFAVCGVPYAYAHAIRIADSWDRAFVSQLAKGIASVLNQCGIGFIGGDTGMANDWGYTGICLGSAHNPLSRKGARAGDKIYLTGEIGAGNIEAAFTLYHQNKLVRLGSMFSENLFRLRATESAFIGQWASCCIDTSDGVFAALNTLSELNDLGYRAEKLPYPPSAKILCQLLQVPKEILFMGECGEYELLFALSPEKEEQFLQAARIAQLKFSPIGEFTPKSDGHWLNGEDRRYDLSQYTLSAREFISKEDYLNKLIDFLRHESQ